MKKKLKKYLKYYKKKNIYNIKEALYILKKYNFTNFISSINLSINLLKKKRDNLLIKKNIYLPYSIGNKYRILVLIDKIYRDNIKKLGINLVGGLKYIKKIELNNFLNFDIIFSNEYYMKYLLKLSKILGKKNLIPNYDNDTIINELNYLKILKKYIKGKNLLIKTDKFGIIHLKIGNIKLDEKKIIKNYLYIIKIINNIKFENKKLKIKNIYINTTMSPSLKLLLKF
ncbi:MAG: hypothetical protein NHG08_00195 [Candidatus Shikimatogenerans sp. JK-2022]|nr:hypothetical protein [Candidatus Shikimatogenerans bostrichidophilus]